MVIIELGCLLSRWTSKVSRSMQWPNDPDPCTSICGDRCAALAQLLMNIKDRQKLVYRVIKMGDDGGITKC
jgi:hypothetical protein